MMVRFRENVAAAAEHDLFFCRKRNIGGSLKECWLVPETGNLSLFASLEVECCSFTKKGIPSSTTERYGTFVGEGIDLNVDLLSAVKSLDDMSKKEFMNKL